jgi:hypothetical protein
MMTLEKLKRDMEQLQERIGSGVGLGLPWEAREILCLYAQGLSSWQRGEHKRSWKANYRDAVDQYGPEFCSPEGPSGKTLYWMMFMIKFRGGMDSKVSSESLMRFWVLARHLYPQTVEKWLLDRKDDPAGMKEFISELDEIWMKVFKDDGKESVAEVK